MKSGSNPSVTRSPNPGAGPGPATPLAETEGGQGASHRRAGCLLAQPACPPRAGEAKLRHWSRPGEGPYRPPGRAPCADGWTRVFRRTLRQPTPKARPKPLKRAACSANERGPLDVISRRKMCHERVEDDDAAQLAQLDPGSSKPSWRRLPPQSTWATRSQDP